jgi:hypothetical protein
MPSCVVAVADGNAYREYQQAGSDKAARTAATLRSTPLRALVLYANPVSASFGAALHSAVVTTFQSRGHEVDDCGLYAEGFNPVVSEQERMQYHDVELNRAPPSRPLPIGCWRPRRLYSSIRVRNPSNRALVSSYAQGGLFGRRPWVRTGRSLGASLASRNLDSSA